MTADPTDDDGLDAELMLRLAAQWLLADPDPETFMRHMAERGPVLFSKALTDDPLAVQRDPMHKVLRSQAVPFFRSLGWVVASAMPLPVHGWRPLRLPLPGRNDPCLCGSLCKFKHCCAPLLAHAPRLDPVWLGSLVVQAMDTRDWAALPASRIAPASVLAAADDLSDRGLPKEALRLLEPWGQAPGPWTAAQAELLDLLADLYLDLGHPRKRKALADNMVERGDAVVQSLGWQRRSMMASDAGRAADARHAFEQAQRLTPDEPRVALLEVTTLLGAQEFERAHERASFHARRLSRLPQASELAPQIEGLQAIARGELDHVAHESTGRPDPSGANESAQPGVGLPFDFNIRPDGVFSALADGVSGLPPARLRLDLAEATALDMGALKSAKPVRAALNKWRKAFHGPSPDDAWALPDGVDEGLQKLDGGEWQQLLQRSPALLDCFEVLDDLLTALHAVPMGLAVSLQAVLLIRAQDLWALLRQRYPQARCEWGWLENRPALRLLAESVSLDASPTAERSFGNLRALVDVLNPKDNQGLRDRLGAVLLRRGDAAAALSLALRYPNDFAGMQWLHVRALLALQQLDLARTVLAAALKSNPHVLKLLCSSRKPRLPDVDSYRVGSVEQARIVVAHQHDLWRDKAVQTWLKTEAHSVAEGGHLQLTLT